MVNRLAFLFVLLFLPFVMKAQEKREAIYHTVQKGEICGKIASNYQTKVDSLVKWNHMTDPNKINVGQKIIVGWQKKEIADEQLDNVTFPPLGLNPDHVQDSIPIVPPTPPINPTTPEPSGRWLWLLLGTLLGLAMGILLYKLLMEKRLKDDRELSETNWSSKNTQLLYQNKQLNDEVLRLRSENRALKQRNKDLDGENKSIREEIAQLKTTQHRVNENKIEEASPVSTHQVSTQTSKPVTTLYADAIIDNYFVKVREVPNEDSIFILHLEGENLASFSIYEPAYHKVMENPSFLDGCDKQILRDTMQLEIVEGRAQRDASNGKWKVINKLNVIIR